MILIRHADTKHEVFVVLIPLVNRYDTDQGNGNRIHNVSHPFVLNVQQTQILGQLPMLKNRITI